MSVGEYYMLSEVIGLLCEVVAFDESLNRGGLESVAFRGLESFIVQCVGHLLKR